MARVSKQFKKGLYLPDGRHCAEAVFRQLQRLGQVPEPKLVRSRLSPCSKPLERSWLLLPGFTHCYVDDRYSISMRFYRERLRLRLFSVLRNIQDDTSNTDCGHVREGIMAAFICADVEL